MNHFIISNFLKASKTFDVYKSVFSRYSINHTYLPIEIKTSSKYRVAKKELEELRRCVNIFRNNADDCSMVISNPFKQVIIDLCDELSNEASIMNTVNLIYKKNGIIYGRNIDGDAFLLGCSKELEYDFSNKSILLLGCGGVSTAVSFALSSQSVSSITLYDIDLSKTVALKNKIKTNFPTVTIKVLKQFDLSSYYDVIYNGTGVGKMSYDPTTVNESPLPTAFRGNKRTLGVDANYTPWQTNFLKGFVDNENITLNGFSHMIGFTSMHLSEVLNQDISYEKVKMIAEDVIDI